ncbi:MAG TPA: S-layer homology domain-containing protein, partial [Bacillota bacterium]|nr:S-layer homology domain-containing protein [Bacillota bacterium]
GIGTADSPQYKGFSWSQSMLAWSQIDGTGVEKIASGIKSAVNGGTGEMWWSGITDVTGMEDAALVIKNWDGVFADRYVSLAQLKERGITGSDWVMNSKGGPTTYDSITGIPARTLLADFTSWPDYAESLYFSDSTGSSSDFKSSTYSGNTPALTNDFDNSMLAWSTNVTGDGSETQLRSALNGGGGKYWWSNVSSMTVSLKNKVDFSVTPANASITVKNNAESTMAPAAANTYILPDGVYTYTITASGYENATGSFTVAADNQSITKVLTAKAGGGGETSYKITGYSGANGTVTSSAASAMSGQPVTLTVAPKSGYVLTGLTLSSGKLKESLSSTGTKYTFVMPSADVTVTAAFEPVELTVYVQKGEKGASNVGALFSRSQLESLATTKLSPTTGYVFYKNDKWEAVAATKYVTLDALLADAGISFGSGDSIKSSASDTFFDTVSYKNIHEYQYYFDPNDSGKKSVAPYIIALEHRSGTLSGSSLSAIASGTQVTSLRSCYGCSEEQYTKKEAFGRRLVSSVISLTVIKSAEVNKNTKDEEAPDTALEVKLDVKVTVANGIAAANVSSGDLAKMLDKVASSGSKSILEINAVSSRETTKSEVALAADAMSLISTNRLAGGLKIMTDQGSILLDQATLQGIASEVKDNPVKISVEKPEKTALTAEQQALVGNHAVYSLSIAAADKKITRFGGDVAVSLPYKLSVGEDPANVVIYHLTSDGKVEKFQAVYDPDTGTVSFTTDHFSVFMTVNEAAAAYDDILMTSWFYDAVNYAVKNGLMAGTAATKFGPGQDMTRAMLVTILWRLEGKPKTTLEASPFTDVKDKNAWYYDAVLWAYEKDIAKGLNRNMFAPAKTLSRQELVTMLHRYSGIDSSKSAAGGVMDTGRFTDWNKVSDWAAEGFRWAYLNGIVTGTTDSTISPDTNATRAQIASILMRYKQI